MFRHFDTLIQLKTQGDSMLPYSVEQLVSAEEITIKKNNLFSRRNHLHLQ